MAQVLPKADPVMNTQKERRNYWKGQKSRKKEKEKKRCARVLFLSLKPKVKVTMPVHCDVAMLQNICTVDYVLKFERETMSGKTTPAKNTIRMIWGQLCRFSRNCSTVSA